MFEKLRGFKVAMMAVVLVALLATVGGLVISQAAGGSSIQATVYDDVVRFAVQSDKVAVLRAEVFNLSGKRLFDSGPVMGKALDWPMTTEAGERVAHGVYLYVITAWDSQGELVKSQVGKLVLVPGGVGLGAAPSRVPASDEPGVAEEGRTVRALTQTINDDLLVKGHITSETGFGSVKTVSTTRGTQGRVGADYDGFYFSSDTAGRAFKILTNDGSGIKTRVWVAANGNVGIGATDPTGTLTIKSASGDNLIEAYNTGVGGSSTDPVFRVERYKPGTGESGNVYADGSYNCGLGSQDACFNANQGADVAERINVSEWVEQGNIIEIDPDHPGFFRKARSPYSPLVAGVISTTPAITLGNNFDAKADIWEDNRPLLALAGRVPVKVTTENGPIQVGDLLVSASTPGYAMRCSDRAVCVGAVIGKALEPLQEETGVIMMQVTLR